MNWDIFSTIGYASIALWLCMPVLWILHMLRRSRGWLCHIALLLGVAAFVLAKVNSQTYVSRIQVDRSEQINEQLAIQEKARQLATAEREGEVAQIRFAEDSAGEFLDTAGMDEADLKYMQSFDDDATPEWKKEKKQRSAGTSDDSLEAMIGATEEEEGVDADTLAEEAPPEPILMSDADKLAADRLDAANLMLIRVMLGLGVVAVAVDYLRRANRYDEAYFPLPLPSGWVDAMTPRSTVTVRSKSPRRTLLEELQVFARRGEAFVFMTDDAKTAARATKTLYRLPCKFSPVNVLKVGADNDAMNDDFVFETVWFGRNSFVVSSSERAEQMLERFMELLSDRRATRARTRRTVHVVWDIEAPIAEETRQQFSGLGHATGYTLLLCKE